ncbi:hypothetical protein [Parashewanella tropica]|uniref:hypothetical protein n=1 Tax=Parashewanella tropica TaxID=2547970 RepID=UPI00105A8482|nr:hypothetical protein [Parashewanella tropica]
MKKPTIWKSTGILIVSLFSIVTTQLHAAEKSSTQYHSILVKPLSVKSENNYSTTILSESGDEFCRINNGLTSNCFPILNTSANSYINVSFDGNSFTGIGPNNHYQIFKLTPYGNPAQVIINNPATNEQVYNGLISDMVGLICDGTQCKPWN